jgi:TetR/AcrR family transcriptional regulator, regulator of cefoperazone and chloramphenicol sensitivity
MVNVQSLPDDRTARARIRDEALRLFAERGPDAVTVRDIAAAAGVSPALVVRHYGSKDGLREAVDTHVAQVFEVLLAQVVRSGGDSGLDPSALPNLLDGLTAHLPAGSAIPDYLGRLLITGGSVGSALFHRLYEVSTHALTGMAESGMATAGSDPEVRAAFLLVNDLAVLILRRHLTEVLDVDPVSAPGMKRWAAEVLTIYRDGLGRATTDRT